jgi:hypothetical protein
MPTPCSINILSVVDNSDHTVTTVSGIATTCGEIHVQIFCSGSQFSGEGFASVQNGNWTIIVNRIIKCPCGTPVSVKAICVDDVQCFTEVTTVIPCSGNCCPVLTYWVEFSCCQSKGQRTAIIHYIVSPPIDDTCKKFIGQLVFPGTIPSVLIDFSSTILPISGVTIPTLLAGGTTQTVALTASSTSNIHCDPLSISFNVPYCGNCCPTLHLDPRPDNCIDGHRQVVFDCTITPPIDINCPPYEGVLTFLGSNISPISINILPGSNPITTSITLTLPIGGTQQIVLSSSIPNLNCCSDITISYLVIDCDDCCPNLLITTTPLGNCDSNGNRLIHIEYTVVASIVATCPDFHGILYFPDGNSIAISVNAGSLVTGTYDVLVSAGSHTISLVPSSPNEADCSTKVTSFDVSCNGCPEIHISHTVGDCNADGTRTVTINANIIGATISSPISAQMTGPCSIVTGNGTGSLTLSTSCALNTGQYQVTVTVPDCPPIVYPFSVADCCPIVQFDHVVCGDPECDEINTRNVTITAKVSPQTNVLTTATLKDSSTGANLATSSGSTPFMLTATSPYGPGTNSVLISFAPSNCPDQTYTFCVPDCESPTCWRLHYFIILVGAVGFFLLALSGVSALGVYLNAWMAPLVANVLALAPIVASTTYQVIMWITLALFLVSLLSWFYKGCGSGCVFLIIIWQISLMMALLFVWVLASCFMLNFGTAIVCSLIAYLFYWLWKKFCCIGKCDALYYLEMAFVALLISAIAIILFTGIWTAVNTAPPYYKWLTLALWLVVGAYYLTLRKKLKKCLKKCPH